MCNKAETFQANIGFNLAQKFLNKYLAFKNRNFWNFFNCENKALPKSCFYIFVYLILVLYHLRYQLMNGRAHGNHFINRLT